MRIWTLISFCVASFENLQVKQESILDTHDVRQEIGIKATCLEGTKRYRLAILTDLTESLSLLRVYQKSQELGVEKAETVGETTYFDVKLPSAVKTGDTIDLTAKFTWIKVAKPFPKVLSQLDADQMYEYFGNKYFYTPYKTIEESHVVKLPKSREPAQYTKGTYKNREISYGPFKDTKPLSNEILHVHYHNNKPALILKNYEKSIKVAYLRPLLHIQEDYELVHEGAKLKGHFSQIDYKLNAFRVDETNSIKKFTAIIPNTATDVYYKDLVGNVSTSNLRFERKRAVLELRPRYPLYGGWKYTWFHGYTIPQSPFLTKVGRDDYSISVSLTPSIKGFTIEKDVLKVILPEGASNVRVESQYGAKVSHYTTFTYLDTTGRPTVVVEKSNVVDEFDKKIKITYTYKLIYVFQKPAVVFAVIVGFISIISFISKLDLSIVEVINVNKDPEKALKKKVQEAKRNVSDLLGKERVALGKIGKAFIEYKNDKNMTRFKEAQQNVFTIVDSCHARLVEIGNQSMYGAAFQARVKSLIQSLKDRAKLIRKHQDQVMAHFEQEQKGKVTDEQRQKLAESLADNETKLEELGVKIQQFSK